MGVSSRRRPVGMVGMMRTTSHTANRLVFIDVDGAGVLGSAPLNWCNYGVATVAFACCSYAASSLKQAIAPVEITSAWPLSGASPLRRVLKRTAREARI